MCFAFSLSVACPLHLRRWRALRSCACRAEMTALFNRYNDLLNDPKYSREWPPFPRSLARSLLSLTRTPSQSSSTLRAPRLSVALSRAHALTLYFSLGARALALLAWRWSTERSWTRADDHNYEEGDCIFIDNLAIAHRASKAAHTSAKKQGLRILHRTTVSPAQAHSPAPTSQPKNRPTITCKKQTNKKHETRSACTHAAECGVGVDGLRVTLTSRAFWTLTDDEPVQVKGMIDFDPQEKFSLPPMINVYGQNPFGSGVWIGGGQCQPFCVAHVHCSLGPWSRAGLGLDVWVWTDGSRSCVSHQRRQGLKSEPVRCCGLLLSTTKCLWRWFASSETVPVVTGVAVAVVLTCRG